MNKQNTRKRSFIIDVCVVFTLFSIAFALPIYQSLGKGATFFVAHNATPLNILVFVVGISLIIPLVFVFTEFALNKINKKARLIFHSALIFILSIGIFLSFLNKVVSFNSIIVLILSASLGLFCTIFIKKIASFPEIVILAGIGVFLLPLHFVGFTPVSDIFFSKNSTSSEIVRTKSKTPVVFVIFDELAEIGLLDKNLNIDAVRFPNFAAFAEHSTRYTKAASTYHKTTQAVPAILTGNFPPSDEKLPFHAAYPNNIFTMLATDYDINAYEDFTSLCPEEACLVGTQNKNFDPSAFLSDLLVIGKHIYYPKKYAEKNLPSLNAGWHNFASKEEKTPQPKEQNKDLAKEFNNRKENLRYLDQGELFQQFVANIQPGNKSLDFAHILLPHHPYKFLPDGRTYNKVPIGPLRKSQEEADQAYHRYLLQLGYADRLFGELITKLKDIGKYEDSLIILTSDHGVLFLPDVLFRDFKTNASVFHVPLIIKTPKQNAPLVDDRFVLNIDILPTIADYLNFENVPKFDGNSLYDKARPELKSFEMSFKGKDYTFKEKEIFDFHAVPNRIAKFGERTPLNKMTVKGKHSEFLGKKISGLQFDAVEEPNSFVLKYSSGEYNNIDNKNRFIPALFTGRIESNSAFKLGTSIGLSVNGEVVGITDGELISKKINKFSVVIPTDSLVDGYNKIDVLLIVEEKNGNKKLIKLQDDSDEAITYSLIKDQKKSEFLVTQTGQKIPIKSRRGGRFRVIRNAGALEFSGWALNSHSGENAEQIFIYHNDEFLASSYADAASSGIAKHYGDDKYKNSGINLILKDDQNIDLDKIRIFGTFPDGVAKELIRLSK